MQDTVDELNCLVSDRLLIEGRRQLKMCICDAPAKAMVNAVLSLLWL